MSRLVRNIALSGGAIAAGVVAGAAMYELGDRPEMPMERLQACTDSFAGKDRANDIPDECQGFNRAFEYHTEPVEVVNSYNSKHEFADGNFYWILPKSEVFKDKVNELNEQDQDLRFIRIIVCGGAGVAVAAGLNVYIWRKDDEEQSITSEAHDRILAKQ